MTDIVSIAADAAEAADLNITAFYGKVQGGVTARDFDFTIGPAGNGVSVEWTSIIRGSGDHKKTEHSAQDKQTRVPAHSQTGRREGG